MYSEDESKLEDLDRRDAGVDISSLDKRLCFKICLRIFKCIRRVGKSREELGGAGRSRDVT